MCSFCTNLRIAKCSHTESMLRFCSLAWHKNNHIIYDFFTLGGADAFFLHQSADSKMLTYGEYRRWDK